MNSIDSSFQPPSPSLSPTSQIRCYQSQLDKAHSMIDQLEVILQEKQDFKENSQNNGNRVKHSKNFSLTLTNEAPTIKSFITPRETQKSNNLFQSKLSPVSMPSYINELQQKHQELLNCNREDSIKKTSKIQEIQEMIQEVKDEIYRCKEQQRLSSHEKNQTKETIESINQEISEVHVKLEESKVKGAQLEDLLHKINEEGNTHKSNYYISSKRKRGDMEVKPHKQLKQQLQTLKSEVQQLKQQKAEYEDHYESRIRSLENQINRNVNVDELNANLSPNRQAVRIYKGSDLLLQLRLNSTQTQRINTDDDQRIRTDQSRVLIEENPSVRSFRPTKNRSCDACAIF